MTVGISFHPLLQCNFHRTQHYIKLGEVEKNRKLNDLLDALDFNQVVIFVKSVSRAAELNKLLVECNFPSICIHSGMSQEERWGSFTFSALCYVLFQLSFLSFSRFPPILSATLYWLLNWRDSQLLWQIDTVQRFQGRAQAYTCGNWSCGPWHWYRTCQHCHQLWYARFCGHILAPSKLSSSSFLSLQYLF